MISSDWTEPVALAAAFVIAGSTIRVYLLPSPAVIAIGIRYLLTGIT
jgi:hypothetical protein